MPTKKTIYYPPAEKLISGYARKVAQDLATQRQNPQLDSPEIVDGFARFVSVMFTMTATFLNNMENQNQE